MSENENNTWTVARVKDKLPCVTACIDGQRRACRVYGRKLRFARVEVTGRTPGACIEVAWETLVHILNTDSALRL